MINLGSKDEVTGEDVVRPGEGMEFEVEFSEEVTLIGRASIEILINEKLLRIWADGGEEGKTGEKILFELDASRLGGLTEEVDISVKEGGFRLEPGATIKDAAGNDLETSISDMSLGGQVVDTHIPFVMNASFYPTFPR